MRNLLSQPGHFAAQETVTAKARGRLLEHVRVVGPLRPRTQLEVSATDAAALDIHPARQISGNLGDAETVELIGPAGSVVVPVILAQRHLHCDPATARAWGIADGEQIRMQITANGAIIDGIVVRVSDDAVPAVHVDEDEAREFGIKKGGEGTIVM